MFSYLVKRRGFTLIETLAAMTILLIVLTQLFSISSTGVRNESRSDFLLHASRDASNLLALLGLEIMISPGQREGRFNDGLVWFLSIDIKNSFSRPSDNSINFDTYYINITVRRPTVYSDFLTFSTLRVVQSKRSR